MGVDQLKTYAEVLALYHLSPECKFENGEPWDRGETGRRRIIASQKHLIGKEANKIADFGDVHPIEGAAITYQSTS